MRTIHLAALTALSLSFSTPLLAQSQEWPVDPGDFVEMSMIKIDDGHALEYMNYLSDTWRKSQEYAKAQGWISGYELWSNEYPRDGEADIYLITFSPKMADAAEAKRRDKQYNEYMKQTVSQMQAASGQRAQYRHLAGSMLMRRQNWAR